MTSLPEASFAVGAVTYRLIRFTVINYAVLSKRPGAPVSQSFKVRALNYHQSLGQSF